MHDNNCALCSMANERIWKMLPDMPSKLNKKYLEIMTSLKIKKLKYGSPSDYLKYEVIPNAY